jgi:hypothetical protein
MNTSAFCSKCNKITDWQPRQSKDYFGNPHSYVACTAGHSFNYSIPATQTTQVTITSYAIDPTSGQVHCEPGDVISLECLSWLLEIGCEFEAAFAPISGQYWIDYDKRRMGAV